MAVARPEGPAPMIRTSRTDILLNCTGARCQVPSAGAEAEGCILRGMRALLTSAAVVLLVASQPSAQTPAPQQPAPVFRAGIELVSVDITAIDNNGRQVTDLTAADLQVEIDGTKRQVATVEYIRSVDP